MARAPKPWFWKARKAWFVTIDGTRHCLGPDKGPALTRFHQVMAEPKQRVVHTDALAPLLDVYLGWCQKHRSPHTYEWYRYRLERFVQTYPNMRVHELRPYHVQEWLDEMDLSSGSKRNYCRSIKRATSWAKRQGYIEKNPIADMEEPRCGRKELVVPAAEFERILELSPDDCFRDLLQTTWETGCRPQESLRVEARHVDLAANRWVFPETEAKGGIPRIVYLTEAAAEITRRLMLVSPSGKLFRNAKGIPWTTFAVNSAFRRIRERIGREVMHEQQREVTEREIRKFVKTLAPTCGVKGRLVEKTERMLYVEARMKLRRQLAISLAPRYSLYALRHSWATHALERGVDALTVAVLMGHRDPSTLAKVYQHLSHNPDYMSEQARRAAG